jgi:hypothetical protein
VPISGIRSSGFDLAFAYKFRVYFGLFPSSNRSLLKVLIVVGSGGAKILTLCSQFKLV